MTSRPFIRRLIWSMPLHVLLAVALVGGSAVYYGTSVSGHGAWTSAGGWSLTIFYVVAALIGGTAAGLLNAAQLIMTQVELSLRDALHALPNLRRATDSTERPLSRIRQEYEETLDQTVHQTNRHLRLPRWMERLILSILRAVVVDRFITSCTERKLTRVPPQEFRNWLLAEGLSLGFMLVQDQLWWWRILVLLLLGLLIGFALGLAFLTS